MYIVKCAFYIVSLLSLSLISLYAPELVILLKLYVKKTADVCCITSAFIILATLSQ